MEPIWIEPVTDFDWCSTIHHTQTQYLSLKLNNYSMENIFFWK